MKDEDGFIDLKGQVRFFVDPDDIIHRMSEGWLQNIQDGHHIMLDIVLPHLEREAIHRFGKEWTVQTSWRPKERDGYEDWRMWWLNEASHNCETHLPIGRAGDHLSQIGRHAVNILMAASSLRDCIDREASEAAAAIGMMLICEAIAGGYSLEFEAVKAEKEAIERAKSETYKKSIGSESADHERARKACIQEAAMIWKADPTRRIGEVSKELNRRLLEKLDKLPSLDMTPAPDTIKGWLKAAAKIGKLTIPEAAQKRGRPTK